MANVSDVLTTKAFKDAVVVAGNKGLINPVKSITVAEVPDASDWLRGGEIVCTTGFFIQDSSVSQVQWIESLINMGAAALAIKPSRFLGEVSDGVKYLANSKKFPIIYLPNDSTWPFIIESVMNLISDEQVARIKRAEEIHKHLTQLVLDGSSVSDISQSLANLVGNPVIVEDARLNIIAVSLPHVPTKDQKEYKDYIIQERKQNQKKLLSSDYYRRVLLGKTKEIFKSTISQSDPIRFITIPIITSNMVYGFLTLVETTKEHRQTDIIALEHGTTTVALQLVKEIVQYKDHREKEQEIIQALIHGRVHTSTLRNLDLPSFDWSSPMAVVLIQSEFEHIDDGLFVMEQPEQTFEKTVKKIIRKTFGECIIGYEKNLFTIIIPFQVNQKKQALLKKLKETMETCMSELQQKYSVQKIKVAIGGVYRLREKTKKSYEDAKITLEIMNVVPEIGPIVCFEHIGVYRLFHMIKDNDTLQAFKNDFIGELLEHDQKKGDSLCETLLTYLRMGGSVSSTAKRLFVHPNTITYRLQKIQSILGDPMENPQYRDSLLLALEIDNYLKTSEG